MSWSARSVWLLGPWQRDVQQRQDGALDAGEVVEDWAAGGVGGGEAVEGGQGGAGGGDGGAVFGQEAGQGGGGGEGGAPLGLEQPDCQPREAEHRGGGPERAMRGGR